SLVIALNVAPTDAQVSIADSSIAFVMPAVSYGGAFPLGRLAQRFGYLSLFTLECGFKFKSHWTLTASGAYLFTDLVRETQIFNHLAFYKNVSNPDGTISTLVFWPDNSGAGYVPTFQGRGFVLALKAGKIFPAFRLPRNNPNCGVAVELGVQFVEHRIFVGLPLGREPNNVTGEYAKGYDRLTNGLGPIVTLGYRFFGNNRLINFFLGAEAACHFTRNRRKINYDLNALDEGLRSDVWVAFRFAWCIPLYRVAPEKFYYY
ncbi:MAG: hypothetical protein RMM53_10985, partial [Bacteroidia bacterium]|nr:hypothetical protein [Bacteroidia bacterium]MDW8334730.1 hypothetical protein [Bacteroidia bacterium]